MENEEEVKQKIREPLLYMAHRLGYISDFDEDALWKWWDSLAPDKKKTIVSGILIEQKREEWHRNKFKTLGWRVWLAGTIPAVFAIRWLVYATGGQKLWAIAIFLGGAIIMRWLINLYDNLRGNPRRVYDEIEGERREQSLFRIFDLSLIVIGIVLIVIGALNSDSVMLKIGGILTAVGILFLFFRTRYLKKANSLKNGSSSK
jgi:hypothetical protein